MNDKREMLYFGIVGNGNINTNGEKRKIDLKNKNLEISGEVALNKDFSIFMQLL